MARGVRVAVEEDEGPLASVDDQPGLVVQARRAAEDAALLLVGAPDVLEPPGCPEPLQNQPRSRKRTSRPITVSTSSPIPRSANACQLDTSSTIQFKDALDYARRSGVVIYPIGLNIGMAAFGVREKLNNLAEATGGRAFYISKAVELATVYDTIEEELRSQYLIAYASNAPVDSNQFRTVEVKTKGKLKARTMAGVPAVAPVQPDGPSIFTEEQLGLRLVSGRGPVEMLVIERLERPSPD